MCLAVLTMTTGTVLASDPITWRTEYAAARKEAEQKNLPLLVVVGTEQCLYCRKLESVTFTDKEVVALVAGGFIPLKVDANKDPEFARSMRVTLYPTTVIAAPDGKIYAYLSGFQSADQFRDSAKKALALIPPDVKSAEPTATLTTRLRTEPTTGLVSAPVKATGPTDPIPGSPTAKDLLAGVKAAFRDERWVDCLDRTDVLAGSYPGTPETEAAAGMVAAIHADAERLAIVSEQTDERFAARYYSLGEAWAAKGRGREAVSAYERVLKFAPNGKYAELVRAKLPKLYAEYPTIKAER